MNMLTSIQAVTMSSIEIAELTKKAHKNVLADCRKLIDEYEKLFNNQLAEISALIFSTTYKDRNNEDKPSFLLSKQATLDLITGYSLPMRHAINKRWMELENQQFTIPRTFAEALRLAADTQEKLDEANLKIEQDKPKVEFAMAVRNMEGACAIGDFCKTIGWGRNKLFKQMREDGILQANNLPYQRYIDRQYFVVIEHIPFTDSNGKTYPAFQTMVTGSGQVFLQTKYKKSESIES